MLELNRNILSNVIRAIILIINILNTNVTINVSIKWSYHKKVLRNHEVHLIMIYYQMKFQSVGSAEFNIVYFHAFWFDEVDGLVQERRNSIFNAPELRLSCTNPSKWKHFLHADLHVSLMVARTTFLTNTRAAGELIFHSLWFIHFSRPTCMWNIAEIFYWVFPKVQPQYSPKPIQILVNTLRPEQWWLMFGTHFQYIFLTWNWLKFVHLPSWL